MHKYSYSFSKLRTSEEGNTTTKLLHVGFWSRLTVWWMNDLMRTGSERPLEEEDLFAVADLETSKDMAERIRQMWLEELKISEKSGAKPSLVRVIYRIGNICDYSVIFFLPLVTCSMMLLRAILLAMILLDMTEYGRQAMPWLCLYITGIFFFTVVEFLGENVAKYRAYCLGIKARSALTSLVYNKLLTTSKEALVKFGPDFIMNVINRDVPQFDEVFTLFPWILAAPPNVAAALVFLWFLTDINMIPCGLYTAMVMVQSLVLLFPLQILRRKALRMSDKRMRIISDVVRGIRAVKTNVWERTFHTFIQTTRIKELYFLKISNYLQATAYSVVSSYVVASSLMTFVSLVLMGIKLSPEDAFTTIIVLASIQKWLGFFKDAIELLSRFLVSLRRIKKVLLLPSKSIDNPSNNFKDQSVKTNESENDFSRFQEEKIFSLNKCPGIIEPCIAVSQARCCWPDTNTTCLSDVNLHLCGNQLVFILGAVGSGKSCLLQSLISEIPLASGKIQISGSVAYVPQTPWIFSGTISENILFGKDFDEKTFYRVIRASLLEDLVTPSQPDVRQVGERGFCLSSGQQAQVSLARALYAGADIYLLDEPFREFDAITRRKIFSQCIRGLLVDRLVVLVTKQLQEAHYADKVLVLKNGTIDDTTTEVQNDWIDDHPEKDGDNENQLKNNRNKLGISPVGSHPKEEDRILGEVTTWIYWKYFRAGTSAAKLIVLLWVMASCSMLSVALKTWYAYWSDMKLEQQSERLNLAIFAGLASAFIFMTIVSSILFQWISLSSSQNLHCSMVTALVKSPVTYFETNPAGRVFNRFCSDVAHLGSEMQVAIIDSLINGLEISGSLFLIVFSNPVMLLALFPYLTMCVWLWYYHLSSARELKRFESIKKTPLYEQIAETLRGIVTIRTHRNEKEQLEKFYRCQEIVNQASFLYWMSFRWAAVRMELLGVLMMAAAAYSVILLSRDDAAFSGLSISQALTFILLYRQFLRNSSHMESHMVSAERILNYAKLQYENKHNGKDFPPELWPRKGSLKLQDISFQHYPRYSKIPHQMPVTIRSGEKIGVVTRNGAGKSSLVHALSKTLSVKGQIFIDGININSLYSTAVRSALAVVPQTPFLFNGSLRLNLDPKNIYSDDQIWRVLGKVQLRDLIEKRSGKDNKLLLQVTENGANFSVGEMQLICLARGLLQDSKIFVIDQATTCLDQEKSDVIQQVLHEELSKCTILFTSPPSTTWMHFDKIIVLDKGRVVEFDKPQNLLERKNSTFTHLLSS